MMESFNDNQTEEKKPDKIENPEKWLLLISLAAAVLADRLLFTTPIEEIFNLFFFAAIFELCFIILYCIFNWRRIYKKPLIWYAAGCIILLCVWNFMFDYLSYYGLLTFAVIPSTLMMLIQFSTEKYKLKQTGGIIKAWFAGWFVQPFSALPRFIQVILDTLFPKNNPIIKKIIVAVSISLPLAGVLIVLLSSADKVFGHYVNMIFRHFNFPDFIGHLFLIVVLLALFYSFFWNSRYIKAKDAAEPFGELSELNELNKPKEIGFDTIISYTVLGTVLALYTLFCAIQFTYLFARMGLPSGISYSEYAREGFAQIVVIAAINLLIFGVILKYGKKNTGVAVMLYGLIGMTAIMLASGFARLGLYIDTFGMTFLRLISAWFIIYLAFVLVLCVLRMMKEQMPLIAVCAFLLLGWYTVFGYINPDAFIVNYNMAANSDSAAWVSGNIDYIRYELSDDAILVLVNDDSCDLYKEDYREVLVSRYNSSVKKYSAASIKLRNCLKSIKIGKGELRSPLQRKYYVRNKNYII